MTVYCVFKYDLDRKTLLSIWSTKELAEAECDIQHDKFPLLAFDYFVEEYNVDMDSA